MRSIAVATVSVLFAGSLVVYAQQSPAPAFTVGTTLVEFTIAAVDHKGNPVTDLKRDEVSILEGDANREVAFFRFEGALGISDVSAAATSLPSGTFTNRTEYAPGAPRHLVAVVLDFVNASLIEQFELRAQFLDYLKQIPSDARVGLYILRDNAVVVHDFTHDAGSLRARLEKGELDVYARALTSTGNMQKLLAGARPEQVGSLTALVQANARSAQDFNLQIARERRQKTLSALESVGDHLAGLPGRKSMVWVSHGFPLTSKLEASYVDDIRDTARRLATHDVAVYPVDAAGVRAYRPDPLASGRVEGTAELVASITGGRPIRNNNDLTLGITVAAEDLQGTYSLGFYAPDNLDNQWHRLVVKVSRPGVILRYRQGYFAASAAVGRAAATAEVDWNNLAFRPLTSTAVRVNVRPSFASGSLRLVLDVAARDLRFRHTDTALMADVEVALVEKSSTGPTNVRVQSAVVRIPSGDNPAIVPIVAEFNLNPHTTSIRIIVRDNATGRLGSVDVPMSGYVAK